VTPVNLSWYLCALFAVALLPCLAVTVHPDAQARMNVLFGGTAGLSILFGIAAVVLRRLGSPKPTWLVRTFQVVAVLGTLLVIAVIGG
jgi:nitrate reductase gamma subunit